MNKFLLIASILVFSSFTLSQTGTYLFVMLKPIPACDGKCNNYEIQEFTLKNAEACKKQEDSCMAKYGKQATYYTVAPGEAVIYYQYNKFVTDCDCKIKGVHKSSSVEKAKEEMNQKIAEERVKKPKAYHNYEVIGWRPE